MASGPSNEELEMYWKNSRQYFDELARYYKTSDPAYYNKNIAPFYTGPFSSSSQSKIKGSSFSTVIISVVILFIGLAAGAVFFLLSSNNEQKIDYDSQKIEKEAGKEIDNTAADTVKSPPIEIDPRKNSTRKKKIERIR